MLSMKNRGWILILLAEAGCYLGPAAPDAVADAGTDGAWTMDGTGAPGDPWPTAVARPAAAAGWSRAWGERPAWPAPATAGYVDPHGDPRVEHPRRVLRIEDPLEAAVVPVEAPAPWPVEPADLGADPEVSWVGLPAGTFTMGSDRGEPDEAPTHGVTLHAFRMSRSEVTVAQYGACVAAGACAPAGRGGACTWGRTGFAAHPVTCVDAAAAEAFCAWAGGRLCTEAEWEYAARSGGRDQAYPWGDAPPSCELAVLYDPDAGGEGCGAGGPRSVCSRPAGNSAQGVCDLAGNAWEWVADGYEAYPAGEVTDPRVAVDRFQATRGGSWSIRRPEVNLRAANRGRLHPRDQVDGIRCCASGP